MLYVFAQPDILTKTFLKYSHPACYLRLNHYCKIFLREHHILGPECHSQFPKPQNMHHFHEHGGQLALQSRMKLLLETCLLIFIPFTESLILILISLYLRHVLRPNVVQHIHQILTKFPESLNIPHMKNSDVPVVLPSPSNIFIMDAVFPVLFSHSCVMILMITLC